MKQGDKLVAILREGSLFKEELTGEKIKIIKIEEVWQPFNDGRFHARAKVTIEFMSSR